MSDPFITPEGVALRHEHAGLGSRSVALLVDGVLQGLVTVAVLLVADQANLQPPPGIAIAVVVAVVYFLHLGYFVVFEAAWEGRTPGKRLARLRVVRVDGQPLGWTGSLIRNLLRLVDSLLFYGVGATVMLVSRDDQRLGDLAAGTIVIHEPGKESLRDAPPATAATWVGRVDVGGVTEREYALARSYLQRRSSLDPEARQRIANEVAATLRTRAIGVPDDVAPDEVIETVVAAVRSR
ncbi:MAG: RDD family protein [Nitriliruptorales bacterium]|nr:RDD family protein [Nitriliruptorales bacterium]